MSQLPGKLPPVSKRFSRRLRLTGMIWCVPAAMIFAGCTDSQPSASDRSNDALQHPMDWKPNFDNSDLSRDSGRFDKPSLGKDLKDVFDP
jgi:hypothetical protein